ncbi:MAG: hypothetical protein COB35_07545 [Gammaproteobacteria bacterium]|nr:MAG: hypothetical protein COB35_07545 [Gammaproteobacteria bacterium]
MVSFDSKTYSKRLLHLISWSHWFTFFNIGVAILLSSIYIIGEPLPETFSGFAYLLSTWFSHMAFLTFFTFVLIVFPLTLLLPRTRFIRTSASIVFTLGLLLLILDAFIYSRLGYHLNVSSQTQIISLIESQIKYNSNSFYLISLVLFMAILSFELVVSNYAWKHLKSLQKTTFARPIIIGFVAAFFFSHITHIWADAKLDYDILQQDTILPLSYPLTAKTLLTKYDLFDRKDYIARRNSPLNFTKKVPEYPQLVNQCLTGSQRTKVTQSTFIVLAEQMITTRQIDNFVQRSNAKAVRLLHHIDNAQGDNAWFNFFYSLPSIYQNDILTQNKSPLFLQALKQRKLATSFTEISSQPTRSSKLLDTLFPTQQILSNSAVLLMANKLNSYPLGLHVFYFNNKNSFQFELFMDALLLAQRQKQSNDIIWVSSIGNIDQHTRLLVKPALLLVPKYIGGKAQAKRVNTNKNINLLTSQMDVMPNLLTHWLDCDLTDVNYTVGQDILTLDKARVIANTVDNGLMVFNKDKSVFIDQNGNFQSYSLQLQSPIVENPDFPLMIDGVRFIKQFTDYTKQKDNNAH